MANMSYCRFQNTVCDLYDCDEAIECDGLPESKMELQSLKAMLDYCQNILNNVDVNELEDAIKSASD